MKFINISIAFLLSATVNKASCQQNKQIQELILADALQSHMVIQQAKPFTLWGKAAPKSTITIKQDWNKEILTVTANEDGNWSSKVSIPPAKTGDFTPHQLTVSNNGKTIALTDLLIGETWLCTGQSNMNMSMQPNLPYHEGVYDFENEIAAADLPGLRIIRVEIAGSETPQENFVGKWDLCTPATVRTFGGVAYYFGRKLLKELNIPIGIVLSAYGGSSCQAWTREEDLLANPNFKKRYWDRFENDSAKKFIRSRMLYNSMIHPLRHLSIRGFLWYQGESNAGDKAMYAELNSTMIKGWRNAFDQGNLPFYFVQMPPYNWKKTDYYEDNYAYFREAQENVLTITPNTGMIVTMDNDEVTRIHPRNKAEFGKRLANLALYRDYNHKELVARGPKMKEVNFDNQEVKITWDIGSENGKLITKSNEAPQHFYVAGSDKVFYKAEAKIKSNTIVLDCDKVKKPVAVRYAFLNFPVTNLSNDAGLPALPFRTDDWPEVTYNDNPLKK